MKNHSPISFCLMALFLVWWPQLCHAANAQPPGTLTVPAASANGTLTVQWKASSTPGVTYRLQESVDPAFAAVTTLYTGVGLTKWLTGRVAGKTYYYRVQAQKTGLTTSAWRVGNNGCAVPGTSKSAIPGALTIPTFDADGGYQVKWGAAATAGVKYLLEEATNAQFSAGRRLVASGTALSRTITGRGQDKTYYYRVRAVKPGLQDSSWRVGKSGCGVPDTVTARKFLAATQGCGSLSPNTVPDTWGVAALRTVASGKYCATWVPPLWESSYLGDGGNFFGDPSGTHGVAIMGGVPYGLSQCTPLAYANWYIALMTGSGSCTSPRMEHYEEGVADFFGTSYLTATFVFTCQKGDTPIVAGAYAAVQSGPYGICSTINLSQWVPVSGIDLEGVCTNAQIVSAQKCADQGTEMCDKPICSNGCKAQGRPGGHCDSFENCVCH